MTDQIMRGTPPAVLPPARNYKFKVMTDHHIIEIPRRGKYSDLAPDFFKEESGEFDILSDNGTLYLPSITKVLFAVKKYPNLTDSQLFVPLTFHFNEDSVSIIGQVIEMVLEDAVEEGEQYGMY